MVEALTQAALLSDGLRQLSYRGEGEQAEAAVFVCLFVYLFIRGGGEGGGVGSQCRATFRGGMSKRGEAQLLYAVGGVVLCTKCWTFLLLLS